MKRRFKRTRVLRQDKGIIRSNEKLIILIFSFIIGVLLGSLTLKNGDTVVTQYIKNLTESYYHRTNSQSIVANILTYLTPDFLAVMASVIFGLCVIGEPIIWLIPLIRGLGIGLNLGYIYSSFKADGLLYSIVFIILPSSLSVCAMIISCKENILTSRELKSRLLKPNDTNNNEFSIKLILIRNLITTLIILITSVCGSLLVWFLGNKITLPI